MNIRPEKTIERMKSGCLVKIVALGDSLTQGWMVSKGYLDFLYEMLKTRYPESRLTILNRGVPGDTAEGGLYRLREDVLDCDPDCVLVQFALNDGFMGIPPQVFQNQLGTIIDHVQNDTEADIVLLTSVFLDDNRENEMAMKYYQKIQDLARKNHLPMARVHEYWKTKIAEGAEFSNLVQYDRVHPTVEGYRLMAEAVMEVF